MSGTEGPGLRQDPPKAGVQEVSSVSNLVEAPDTVQYRVRVDGVLKKFDCKPDGSEWTEEEINSGAAEAAGSLAEVMTIEDGHVTDVWRRDDDGEESSRGS
jgi:hypothetical protein